MKPELRPSIYTGFWTPPPRTRRRPRPQPPAPDVPAPRRPVLRLQPPSPQAVRSAVTDTAVVTGRNLRHFIRQPDLLVFSTIQPVLFVLLFVYVFGGAIGRSLPHGAAYAGFLLPGGLRPAGDLRRLADGGRPVPGPGTRGGRPVPVHADGPLGRAGRAHRGRPGPRHPHHRADDRRRVPGRVPLPRRGGRSGRLHRRRRRLRLRPQLDLRLRGAHRPGAPRRRRRPGSW